MVVVEAAIAKAEKYAVQESGDSAEMVERPRGGMSVVVSDGQRSGRAAKAISQLVGRKAVALISEGVRDGAAARAASDYLLVARRGQVSADMVVLSADVATQTLVITRNTPCPMLLVVDGEVTCLDAPTQPLGTSRSVRPQVTEVPLHPDTMAVAFTDGVWEAGTLSTKPSSVPEWMLREAESEFDTAQALADRILDRALQLDKGRPRDDMTVAVFLVRRVEQSLSTRRMSVWMPLGEA